MGFFILKDRSIVLHKSDPDKGREPQISGDVGQLDDGRLFARFELPGEGGPIVGCRPWTEGEDPRLVPRPAVEDVWSWQRCRFESFNQGWHRWNRSGEPNERARFAEQWPEIAGILGLTPLPEHWLIDVGDVIYPRDFEIPQWREYLDRHAVGNYGLYGQHPEEPVSVSQAWTIVLQSHPIRARHAVDAGRGVIRSRWALPLAAQSRFKKSEFLTAAAYTADITTVYADRGRRTLVEPVIHPNGIESDVAETA
jgi:hypothetical protein